MCQSIWLVDERKEIRTVSQFLDHFGQKPIWNHEDYGNNPPQIEGESPEDLSYCLCGFDLERTAEAWGYREMDHDGDPMEYYWKPIRA